MVEELQGTVPAANAVDVTKKTKGFTLIEAAIVLAIVGLVVGGIWIAAAAVQENFRQSNTLSQVLELTQNIRNVYYGQATNTGLLTANLIQAGAVPAEMGTAVPLTNAWGGTVTIATVDTTHFSVAYTAVPQSACVTLLTRSTSSGAEMGLTSITPGAWVLATNTPLSPSDAAGDCADVSNNTVTWTFSLRS